MTPMIDVVFLLLTFFVMTFKIIVPEGDFNITMQAQSKQQAEDISKESVQVRLLADAQGTLSAIQLNGENLDNFGILRQRVLEISLANPDLEVNLFPDEHLLYEFVIQAVTAVNGELREGQIHTICDKIRFVRDKNERQR